MQRIYQNLIQDHLAKYRQMAFLSGPRQVGKTTLSKRCVEQSGNPCLYLNWDDQESREIILSGIDTIYQQFQPDILQPKDQRPVIIFDEVHKYREWKNMLKGYCDKIEERCRIMVTGSAKLNVYRRGGDSMMGRYFLYRIHPLSVAELLGRNDFTQEIVSPKQFPNEEWQRLIKFGGFPEPYFNADETFYRRWMNLKQDQLFKEDLRDLSKSHDIARMELLAQLLTQQVSSSVKYSELAKKIQVSEPTIRNWINILCHVYYCFTITPWSRNVTRSLLKAPKVYCWDWSMVKDPGARLENLVACHLRKATHFWTDIGLGKYELYYLRDKDKREVDFLVTKNDEPWIMIEVKSSSNGRLHPNLLHFNANLNVPHVLQVVEQLPYIEKDCFSLMELKVVPLLTFLAQLV